MTDTVHDFLPCGIEYGVMPFPQRHIVTFQLRVLSGIGTEPEDKLGLARLLLDTIDKGTQQRSGRELSDAFDAIGASHRSGDRLTLAYSLTRVVDSVGDDEVVRGVADNFESLDERNT